MYQEVFGSEAGQIVLADLSRKFHMLASTKVHGDADGDMAFREGQRNVLLYILAQVDCDLNQLRQNRQMNQPEIIND